jgi:hypothetical protein
VLRENVQCGTRDRRDLDDADWRWGVRQMITAARETYVHVPGRNVLWKHVRPYVRDAIREWLARGAPITLEWLN